MYILQYRHIVKFMKGKFTYIYNQTWKPRIRYEGCRFNVLVFVNNWYGHWCACTGALPMLSTTKVDRLHDYIPLNRFKYHTSLALNETEGYYSCKIRKVISLGLSRKCYNTRMNGPKSGHCNRHWSYLSWNTNITIGWATHQSTIQKFNHCVHNDFHFIKLIEWKSLSTL